MIVAAALAILVPAAGASAHVRVHPDSTTSGGYAQLTFRVPNESPTAGTVKLEVTLPQDHPLTSVSTTPVPGWSVSVTTADLPTPVDVGGATITKAPRKVTWTARKGTQIGPGEYQDFPISVGPLPAPGELVLPASQTYTDGTVVAWADRAAADGTEPDHPAPSFTVTAADSEGAHGSAAPGPTGLASDAGSASSTQVTDPTAADMTARWMGGASLLVGLLALAGVGLLLGRQRRDTAPRRAESTGGTA